MKFAGIILTRSAWPLEPDELGCPLQLPPELQALSSRFSEFYELKYRSRSVEWIHERSKVEILTQWLPKVYQITLNHFQVAVLLRFNRATSSDGSCSMAELDSLGMDPRYLSATLVPLVRIGLLQKQPTSAQPPFASNVRFRLGRGFSQQKVKLDASVLWRKPAVESHNDGELEILNRQRDLNTQAAIVRIMKARRVLSHQQLVEEVTKQTERWFPAVVGRIKTQIDELINHNPPFLVRIDARTYRYADDDSSEGK